RFQLLTRDGIVFFNDPDSEHAGVIRLDGGVLPIAKYDPKDPNQGLSGQSDQPDPSHQPTPPGSTRPQSSTAAPTTDALTVRIAVSSTRPGVGRAVAARVTSPSRPGPVSARWTFGDGQGADGLRAGHAWAAAGTYQLSVVAMFPDGRTATA